MVSAEDMVYAAECAADRWYQNQPGDLYTTRVVLINIILYGHDFTTHCQCIKFGDLLNPRSHHGADQRTKSEIRQLKRDCTGMSARSFNSSTRFLARILYRSLVTVQEGVYQAQKFGSNITLQQSQPSCGNCTLRISVGDLISFNQSIRAVQYSQDIPGA